ncbi:g5033 [Coccomyxa viridis]|uniref:G5033 protein n=1 Tax=Coccomyxa viridis TaxID=1274662 RepID=A0ABP1FRS4_9CHLO
MGLLLAGAGTVTAGVYLCKSESKRTSPGERYVWNTHAASWKSYSDKAVQLARERKLEDAEESLSIALSEAIKGFGSDHPHTEEARQNLADHYGKMHKYDLAVPLYIEGEGLPPVVAHLIGMSGGATRGRQLMEPVMKFEAEEQQEPIEKLSDAEAICRALINNLKKHWGVGDDLSNLYTALARIVRAQGRLDEARQLCKEANNHYLGYFGTYVAKSNLKMPALELLREIELEDGSRDSLLRALDYRQGCCTSKQAELDKILDTIESGPPSVGPLVWDRLLDTYRRDVASNILELTEAQQRLAEVQSRLDDNLGAWAALTHALALLHSPVLAQALDEWEKDGWRYTAERLRETAGKRKQEIQHQMSALHKAICSSFVDCNNS